MTETVSGEIAGSEAAALLYLDLMKRCLTRSLFPESAYRAVMSPLLRRSPVARALCSVVNRLLGPTGLELARRYSAAERDQGTEWPVDAETMIGMARLQNIQDCVTDVLQNAVPGDLIETGAWRGGACIFMRAILAAYDNQDKKVWVADSFAGLPKADGRYAQDAGDPHWEYGDVLAVSLEEVRSNFERYGLLDDRVRFLKGWFRDTLPGAEIGQISVLRLDGDMYTSTMDALAALYQKLSPGGYAIVDDYGAIPACREAVNDYRREHGITEPIQETDWTGVFWKRSS